MVEVDKLNYQQMKKKESTIDKNLFRATSMDTPAYLYTVPC